MAPFEVGIIGGGIGGLSTAIALRRAGVNVEIFEKSTYSNESGNAIYITPNAGRILDKWGLNTPPKAPGSSTLSAEVYSTARPVEVTRVVVLPAKTLDPPTVVDLTNAQADYDTTVKLYDREDLHSALRVLATAPTPSFSRMTHIHNAGDVVLRLGALVVDVDSVAGTLKLKDGDTIKKDLIIVADGIQSRFMEYINHHPNLLRDMGLTGYHFSVPMSALLEDPDLAPLTGALLDQNATPSSSGLPQAPYVALVDNDAELLVVVSAIKGGEAVRIFTHRGPGNDDDYKDTAVIYDNGHEPKGKISERGEQKEQEDTDGDLHAWNNRRASKNDVLRNVEQFHPVLSKLVQKATDIRSFTMRIRDPVKHLHNGLATMLGDSAGATWALQAERANVAIEQAGALETLFLAEPDHHTNVHDLMTVYNAVLKDRELDLKKVAVPPDPAGAAPEASQKDVLLSQKDTLLSQKDLHVGKGMSVKPSAKLIDTVKDKVQMLVKANQKDEQPQPEHEPTSDWQRFLWNVGFLSTILGQHYMWTYDLSAVAKKAWAEFPE